MQIATEPNFGNAAPIAIELIPAGSSVCLQSFNLTLSVNFFTQLTERLSGNLKIEITSKGELLFSQTYPIDILAYDQWGRLNVLPEMLAAFITPNHVAITSIIKRTASFEEHGQRVRLVDSVMSQKLGTCLDMALLYAACLESIGLNPLIIITRGHAFAGKRTAEGIFSFNKFIMWNDIHNNADKLIQNKIVSSLVSGKIE